MSHRQISPQGVRWGNIFNLNLDTIGPVRHRKNGLGVLKPQKPLPETRLSINTRYSPQLPSSLFSLPLFLFLSLTLSCWALHSYIYTASSFKHWTIDRKIAQIRKIKAAEAWFFFWRNISLLLFLWEWEWVREARYQAPMLLLLLVWQVSRAIQKYFRTRPLWSPAACTLWFYNKDGWESYSALQSWLRNAPVFL